MVIANQEKVPARSRNLSFQYWGKEKDCKRRKTLKVLE
ncbi:hypothetical protein VIPARAQ4037_A1306 [Vibrio parahaemolyticus AQ4037]|nr:hypothetical protein VIPARAQ4037_A1306 [Vibrio parahaemolyticus AQ4037]